MSMALANDDLNLFAITGTGSNPGWVAGYVPPATEWNDWWSRKLDLLGGSMLGPLNVTSPSEFKFNKTSDANIGARWLPTGTDRRLLLLHRDTSSASDGALFESDYTTTHSGGTGV